MTFSTYFDRSHDSEGILNHRSAGNKVIKRVISGLAVLALTLFGKLLLF